MSIALSLFFSTFLLEDVALVSALAFIAKGQISFFDAFLACALGIAVGDIGLYFLGKFSTQISYVKRKTEAVQFKAFLDALKRNRKMDYAVIVSRAVPGTRVPTYLAAGVIRYSLSKFILLTALSVAAWVFASLYFGHAFFKLFDDNWLLASVLAFALLILVKRSIALSRDKWLLKAALHSWRKWLHFEFWPAWLFYLPIIPYYLFLSVRYRSLFIPFYASPHLKHGGLIGESKWDFLKHLDTRSATTLPAFVVGKNVASAEIFKNLQDQAIAFPFVVKPDVGQRGFGVRIVKNEEDLLDYLALSEGEIIIQKKSQFVSEAGVFYVRNPASSDGFVFSITDKKFPYVIGDGESRLGELVLRDERARIIASTYFERHKEVLDQVIPSGTEYVLSECGNHCQGARFENGNRLATPELLQAIEQIACQIPGFYFGRIDIRYKDEASLKSGQSFEIIEVNGAGSEATHIWDADTKLLDAYRVLFQQWSHLFSVGAAVKKRGECRKPQVLQFLLDCLKVCFRKGPLTTSS